MHLTGLHSENTAHYRSMMLIMASVLMCALVPASAAGQSYYAGRWDSTLYNMSDHPRTIALRVVVEDADTRLPLEGVELTLDGQYEDQRSTAPREFVLRAVTGKDGVAVFALLWHGESGIDDIEKAQRIIARRNGYRYAETRLHFGRIIRSHRDYEHDGWKNLTRETPGARYFLPVIGVRFDDYNNRASARPDFFRLVRDQDYGQVFRARGDTADDFPMYFTTSNPQREAGPYMMLPLTFRMERVFDEHRVTIEGERRRGWAEEQQPSRSSRPSRRPQAHAQESRTESGLDHRVWERYGDGYISEDQYHNVEKYINRAMSKAQIVAVFGPPSSESVSAVGNTVMHWQSWENSRHGIMVVIDPGGKVNRIEKN